MLTKWLMQEYGYRGTVLMVAGVSLHMFIGVALMQPVRWHMKKVEVTNEEGEGEKKLLLKKGVVLETHTVEAPTVTLTDVDYPEANTDKEKQVYNMLSVEKEKSGVVRMLSEKLNLKALRPFILSNACISLSFSCFIEAYFLLTQPQAYYALKWDDSKVALALSLTAFGDLAAHCLVIAINKWLLIIGSHEVYVIGLVISVITKLGMLWFENQTVVLVFITLMGISRCTIFMFIPMVIADAVDIEHFSSAMGMYMLFYGLISVVFGPIFGAINDFTDSYETVFYILTASFGIIIISWTIELCYKKNKQKKNARNDLEN